LVSEQEAIHSLPEDNDEQLIAAFARGSTEAFNTLFARYRQPVYGFFCRRVADRSVAEELAQETFLAILRARDRYQPTALFRTWLYAIALRILRSYRRKAAFRAIFSGTMPADHDRADAGVSGNELVLRDAVRRLDRIDREVLLLREFEEFSYAEISTVLGIPLNTVRSRLFRARAALREILEAGPARTRAGLSKLEEHA
jgi:RNA polymerase sigma-70 factor, ECF subfamily